MTARLSKAIPRSCSNRSVGDSVSSPVLTCLSVAINSSLYSFLTHQSVESRMSSSSSSSMSEAKKAIYICSAAKARTCKRSQHSSMPRELSTLYGLWEKYA